MKKFSQWNNKDVKEEGVNPTDPNSAGSDQSLDNVGVPFHYPAAEKVALFQSEEERNSKEYQKALHDLMNKRGKEKKTAAEEEADDPTKAAHGTTEGGTLDAKLKSYLKDYIEKEKEIRAKLEKERNAVDIKSPSGIFIPDPKGLFSPRTDINPKGGNADKHGETIEQEQD